MTPTPEPCTPRWIRTLTEKYEAGVAHAFILHLNVNDLVEGAAYLRTYLAQALASRDILVFYDVAHGIQFALPSQRQDFVDLLDLTQVQAPGPVNAAMAALMGAAPKLGPQELQLPTSPGEALPLLEELLLNPAKTSAVVIFNAEAVVPDAGMATLSPADRTTLIRLAGWGRDARLSEAGNPVILVTQTLEDLHATLRAASSKFEAIEIPLPDHAGRQAFLAAKLAGDMVLASDLTPFEAASATAGLSYVHIEDILLRAQATGRLARGLIKERKDSIIAAEYGDVLEFLEPTYGFEAIGGLEHVKRFFVNNVIRPIQQGRWRRAPMGVLMTGPAGTGKSAMAVAVAREAGINAVRLQLGGKIASKWQGEGERNLDKALRAIEGLQPTIVFIDEIDQALRRGDGAGGNQQENRIFQRLLEFMSDTAHRGRVIFLAATNRPDLLDAALRRPGRFDKKIPFLTPERDERLAILQVMARRYGLAERLDFVSDAVLDRTDGWTGAELEAVTVKASEITEDEGLDVEAALLAASLRFSPSTADIDLMTMLAIRECNDMDLLPPRYRALLADRSQLDQQIEQAQELGQRRGGRKL